MAQKFNNLIKKLTGLLAAIVVLASFIIPVSANEEFLEGEYNIPKELENVKVDKSASPLNENLETEININFIRSKTTDIVFVLDKSGASAFDEINQKAKALLENFKKDSDERDLKIKIGIVSFDKGGHINLPLTDIKDNYENIKNSMENLFLSGGSNLQAGLLAGKEVLDSDEKVPASSKHMIIMSDYHTYLYCKNGDYNVPYTRSYGNINGVDFKGGINEFVARDNNSPGINVNYPSWHNIVQKDCFGYTLDSYMTEKREAEPNCTKYDFEYTQIWGRPTAKNRTKNIPIGKETVTNSEAAFIYAEDTFNDIVKAGYQTHLYYFVNAKLEGDFPYKRITAYIGRKALDDESKWEKLAIFKEDFSQFAKEVLKGEIPARSYVEDIISKDFDFVDNLSKISLKVGDNEFAPTKISENKTENEIHIEYGFNKKDDGTYGYELSYDKRVDEKLKLTINEDILTDKKVILKYNEKLVNIPGSDGKIYKLPTNEKAELWVANPDKDAENKFIGYIPFPIPVVEYSKKPVEPKSEPEPIEPIVFKDHIDEVTYKVDAVLNRDLHYAYLKGYKDSTFRPENDMTRAEVIEMFARLLAKNPEEVQKSEDLTAFTDIAKDAWYYNAVVFMEKKGLISGYKDGSFKPDGKITRAEFAALASRFDKLSEGKDTNFIDLTKDHWAYKNIASAAEKKWISGYPDKTFKPENPISRAEVTSITNRMLNRHGDNDFINAHIDELIPFNDINGHWAYLDIVEATNGHDFIRQSDGKSEKWTELNHKSFHI